MGVFYLLTILVFWVPTALIGVIYVIMGSKLFSAAKHLEDMRRQNTSAPLESALNRLQSYIFLNGFILALSIVFLIFAVYLFTTTDTIFWEFWRETGEEFA